MQYHISGNPSMAKKNQPERQASTEEKIKEAARKVFTQKGYAGTRTRDIAEAAGINLALLNYYFRSKEKLFAIIMAEKVQRLFSVLEPVLNDAETTLDAKLEKVADGYITLISEAPDLPIFVLNEVKNNPEQFADKIQVGKILTESVLVRQLLDANLNVNPLHMLINLLAMCVFPFIMRPVIMAGGTFKPEIFRQLMEERKQLIPAWVKAMLAVS